MLMLRGKAEWNPFYADNKLVGFSCSNCGFMPRGEYLRYCQSCGRRMKEAVLLVVQKEEKND